MISSIAARQPRLSAYARTKREGEETLAALLDAAGEWVIVRPCAIYGPWDLETLGIFRAISRRVLLRPRVPDARVSLIHVTDASRAVTALCDSAAAGSVLELTDERTEGYSWDEIIRAAEAALRVKTLAIPLPGAALRAAATVNFACAWALRRTPMLTPGKAREILHADWGSTAERQPPGWAWRPAIGLGPGFRETVDWYRARGWLPPERPRLVA